MKSSGGREETVGKKARRKYTIAGGESPSASVSGRGDAFITDEAAERERAASFPSWKYPRVNNAEIRKKI